MDKSFREHVASLPLAEQQAIREAERKWVAAHHAGVADDPAIRDFVESFSGYCDPPAGTKEGHEARLDPLLSLVPGIPAETERERVGLDSRRHL